MSDCRHCTPCALDRIELSLAELMRASSRMEIAMALEADLLNQIKSGVLDVHADVRAKLDQVRAEVSPEGQAKFDEVIEALTAFDAEIGDADGSDTPLAEEPAPVDGGDSDAQPTT